MTYRSAARRQRARLLSAALLALSACVRAPAPEPRQAGAAPPPEALLGVEVASAAVEPPADLPALPREFRGVWIATVGNMDWPSRAGLPVEQQQAELRAILDRAAELGLNAVIFQVRTAADAFYASPYEPWSEYLTGRMGEAPEPFYDPLEFAIREAHLRGMELHAWFNPYRARYSSVRSPASADHVSRAQPGLVRRYGVHLWMDPAEPAVQDHAVRVILDVVRRYDVDGVHIDDYFYPYREYDAGGRLIQFPDEAAYGRYRAAGGALGRSDWRRHNVDRFVERLYGEIKREKPEVKFGISPFGIWRPGYPAQIQGLDAYEEIFADARKWLRNGWLDYFTPQLYWPIAAQAQSFPVLLNWWVEQNLHGRHIWPGGYTGRVGTTPRSWPAREIVDQIRATREHPGATGYVHFNMTSLMRSPDGVSELLGGEAYAAPALVPATPWLHRDAPGRPSVRVRAQTAVETRLAVEPTSVEEVRLWTVRSRRGTGWDLRVLPGWRRELVVPGAPAEIVVSAIGRTGNESAPVTLVP